MILQNRPKKKTANIPAGRLSLTMILVGSAVLVSPVSWAQSTQAPAAQRSATHASAAQSSKSRTSTPQGQASITSAKQVIYRNTLDMEMVRIPAGHFQMGNPLTHEQMRTTYPDIDAERIRLLKDEYPQHEVRITRDFYLSKHEITRGQFAQFLKESGYVPESIADGTGGYGYNPAYDPEKTRRQDAFEGRSPLYSWMNPGFPQDARHPVVNVTWDDAQALAAWLSKKEGRRYRLPTEAEWEYACRAGESEPNTAQAVSEHFKQRGNIFDQDSAANWAKWQAFALPIRDGFPFTAPVGQFQANAFGLHDMQGNVWEWTNDWHDEDTYSKSPLKNPQGPKEGSVKVRRGGSWHTWSIYARCGYRNWNSTSTRYTLVGIRLAMDAVRK